MARFAGIFVEYVYPVDAQTLREIENLFSSLHLERSDKIIKARLTIE